MQTFDTSYSYDRFSFKLGLNDVIISRHPFHLGDKKLLFCIYNFFMFIMRIFNSPNFILFGICFSHVSHLIIKRLNNIYIYTLI